MPFDLFGVLSAAIGTGIICFALLFARTAFSYLGAVLIAGGFLIVAFS